MLSATLKDVRGVFDRDPARAKEAHRFSALSWETATSVAGALIQSKALEFARAQSLPFEVGRPNEAACTRVGHVRDEWAPLSELRKPLRIALLGCGVVGRGVYETLKRYPEAFEIHHVLVRQVESYPGVDHLTIDPAVVIGDDIDVVIVCIGGITLPYSLIAASLTAGKFVVTANKAAVAAHGKALAPYAQGTSRRLWYSAAVGGAMPVLETLARLEAARLELPAELKPLLRLPSSARFRSPVREVRGILNGTCGVVLDACAQGCNQRDAVALAQAQGFAEADPSRDLSGRDSADKLALIVGAAFGEWIDPERIPTRGIEAFPDDPTGFQLIARASWSTEGITARVGPEVAAADSFLGQARGAENRLEIELKSGEVVRLRAQGAGRWATTISVLGDLHEVGRVVETA